MYVDQKIKKNKNRGVTLAFPDYEGTEIGG